MEKRYIFGAVAFTMIAILGISMVSAFSFGNGFMRHDVSEDERAEMFENANALRASIEDKDFELWKSLMEKQIAKMQDSLTEENFNEFVERHAEMIASRNSFEKGEQMHLNGHQGLNSFAECHLTK